jgi:hypothetical protein
VSIHASYFEFNIKHPIPYDNLGIDLSMFIETNKQKQNFII